jgi:hypothetical protein
MQKQQKKDTEKNQGLELKICQRCGNRYYVIKIKEPENWIEFGIRFCHYCGLPTDEKGSVILN